MCGIVGAVCERDVYGILIEGLKRLEYRGYDSAGLSLLDNGKINTKKTIGKVVDLENLFGESLPARDNVENQSFLAVTVKKA